ncbi:exonuclease SbcCD subunit D C-terminal domain-containing protein [Clostridium estertheticum]|uniref:Nuclease SbcCD subunit D n=1 Tax=Clostridium estertheticum TaxID=238834 RepID=A0AA47EK09_9CLOT|nr:exonuclease SbcCD subunit D [Clostridium estertheticum]MBU3155570.1 exonuclease SbcCD subunit D C-terminal domain-containing protein [Clostridium estertheticum]MBU3198093.1 exonuclease SbcCD subunit D C-terminal domain-containing protein [Clostridium estertheticum]WAG60033.1 exonuclease SbcCD subunit D C-terminal domain-containing protein [Clostridium estertheticum]WAG65887.1 exonuclease SbcCD subunit D C-terminal domain-containing protein [Clostridium estertheticum]
MRILHTSDWHLGKTLEQYSRLEEQEEFLKEFIEIVKDNDIDLVLIAGDIYDNGNPPAKAEKMFYSTISDITSSGKTAVLVIAGNHDNPERLVAASPLAYEHGVILLGEPKSIARQGVFGEFKTDNDYDFEIIESGEGYIELSIRGEKAVILTLPYPSEKRLNEVLSTELNDEDRQRSYSDRIGELFDDLSLKYRDDTINLVISHLYVMGGEESGSERSIQLGGSLSVSPTKFPKKAQYCALGHLHRPQKVPGTKGKIRYSGSPIQYSKSEINYSKGAYLVDVKAGADAEISNILFRNYKPIEIWKCDSTEEALEKCKFDGEKKIWVYLEIKTKEIISTENIKEMKRLRPDIVSIQPIIDEIEDSKELNESLREKSMEEMFKEYFVLAKGGLEPTSELMELFLSIALDEEETKDETGKS